MRIGVPWILGVLSVAPFFARASYIKFGLPDLGAWDFIRQQFFGPFYQQGHYWFLGVLLFFQAAYALAVKYFPARDAAKKFRSVQWIALLGLVTALAYWLSTRYLMPADNWLNIGYILYFQPARLVGYTSAFALGIAGWHMRWFTPGGWTPRVLQSGVFAAAAGCTLLCWRFIAAPGLSPGQNMLCDAILYTCVSVSMPFFLTAAALRTQDRFARIAKFFAPHSYSIYWLHQIVLMPVLYILLPLNIPIALKWLVSLPTTLAICRGISAVFLKRLPFF